MSISTKSSNQVVDSMNPALISVEPISRQALEALFYANDAQVPQESLRCDLLNLLAISEEICATTNLAAKRDFYFSKYRILFKETQAKYNDFLDLNSLKDLKAYEKSMDGLYEFFIIQNRMLMSFEETKTEIEKYQILYTGMTMLSACLDDYLIYFSGNIAEAIKMIASSVLEDKNLQPSPTIKTKDPDIYSYLVGLSNTAHVVLQKLGNSHERQVKLYNSLPINSVFFQEMQVKNNQKFMDWLQSKQA